MLEQILVGLCTVLTPVEQPTPVPTVRIRNSTEKSVTVHVVFDYAALAKPRIIFPPVAIRSTGTTIALGRYITLTAGQECIVFPAEGNLLGASWKMSHATAVRSVAGEALVANVTGYELKKFGTTVKVMPNCRDSY